MNRDTGDTGHTGYFNYYIGLEVGIRVKKGCVPCVPCVSPSVVSKIGGSQ
jgi:hypothetical protein